jgi:hypothetical protein
MNDHDAMTAVNTVLDEWLKGEISESEALIRISRISGSNALDHAEAAQR